MVTSKNAARWDKGNSFLVGMQSRSNGPQEVNIVNLQRARLPKNVELNRDMMLDAIEEIEEQCDQAYYLYKTTNIRSNGITTRNYGRDP